MAVIDIDALREEALATEEGQAFAQGYEVICRGIAFRVPPSALWPMQVFKLQGQGDLYGALVALLGADLAEALTDAGMVLDDLQRLSTAVPEPGGLSSRRPPSRKSSAPGG
jgi:hypothetical protein